MKQTVQVNQDAVPKVDKNPVTEEPKKKSKKSTKPVESETDLFSEVEKTADEGD